MGRFPGQTWCGQRTVAIAIVALACLLRSGAEDRKDQFTPVVASPLVSSVEPFLGTDGKYHLVYELVISNTRAVPATVRDVAVLRANDPRPIATFSGDALSSRLRGLNSGPPDSPVIELNGTRLLLLDVAFDRAGDVPSKLVHRIDALGAASPASGPKDAPAAVIYTGAPIAVTKDVPVLGPPLTGKGWVAMNGCCAPGGAHRGSGLPVNGKIAFAQRFAIDWMRVDNSGSFVQGDLADVHNYVDYGAEVIAVADGKVIETLDQLDDQSPPNLPDPRSITIQNVDGNHIVIDIGNGHYAFYAHLERHSLKVNPGDHVTRGQVLARLGNTGNTSAPHLHFHIMDGPSVLGSNGLPYVIDSFGYAGSIDKSKYEKASSIEGSFFTQGSVSPRKDQFPMDLNAVDFPAAK